MVAWQKIFLIAVGIAVIDSFDEILFGGHGFLADFSLVATLIAIAYIIGSLIIWVALAIESIVLLDFLTPLEALIEIFFMFIGIVGGSLSDFLFNVMKFPFQFIANLAESLGIATKFFLGIGNFFGQGAVGGIDLETMTFMLGFRVDILGVRLQIGFNVSILGVNAVNNIYAKFDFGSVGALGIGARVRFTLGETLDDTLAISMQGLIESVFNAIQFRSDPQAVFEEILQKIQDLGRKLGF